MTSTSGRARARCLRWLWAALALLFLSFQTGAAKPLHRPSAKVHKVSAKKAVARKAVVKKAARKKKVVAKQRGTKKRMLAKHAPRRVTTASAPERLVLDSHVALVVDQETEQVLIQKNASSVLPIASLTKLMTGVIVSEADLPMDEKITITGDDVDRLKFSSSRLKVGTELTRAQALHLALMSSENRAAHALARTYPGGISAFVSAMNVKARQLEMDDTHYVDPTGLSSSNRSSARDLAALATAAYELPLVRKYSTSPGYQLAVGDGSLRYVNTNRLVRNPTWKIGLQKTGFISEAGQCLLVQTRVLGRKMIMVFLNASDKLARIRDAEQARRWIRSHPELARAAAQEPEARPLAAEPES